MGVPGGRYSGGQSKLGTLGGSLGGRYTVGTLGPADTLRPEGPAQGPGFPYSSWALLRSGYPEVPAFGMPILSTKNMLNLNPYIHFQNNSRTSRLPSNTPSFGHWIDTISFTTTWHFSASSSVA